MADYNTGHGTTQEIDPAVIIKDPITHSERDSGIGLTLTPDEVEFFKSQGYLVKRGVIQDESLFEAIADYMWAQVPRGLLSREDSGSWLNEPHKHWTEADHRRVGLLHKGNWKIRSADRIGRETFLVDGVARHPNMLALARQFVGENVKPVSRVRGIYAILPKPPHVRGALGPHADYAAGQLGAMVVAADMPPASGGFTVWPGSHRRLHEAWDTCFGSAMTGANVAAYAEIRDAILSDTVPVETHGRPGDVIFWHHRLLHSPGINRTADTDTPRVRVIVPCDYQAGGKTYYDDELFGPGANYQWWLDTRNFREDVPPDETNIWQAWAI